MPITAILFAMRCCMWCSGEWDLRVGGCWDGCCDKGVCRCVQVSDE